jgi:hypothetical protein
MFVAKSSNPQIEMVAKRFSALDLRPLGAAKRSEDGSTLN